MQLVEAHPHVAAEDDQRPQEYDDREDDDGVGPAEAPRPVDLLTRRFRIGPRHDFGASGRLEWSAA